MPNQISENRFVSFDGGITCDGQLIVPDDKSVLLSPALFADVLKPDVAAEGANRGLIPRGTGLSFAAASFGKNVTSIDMRKLDRITVLENETQTVTVDAGVKVGVLLEFLTSQGYFLSALPGYPTITIGGCIAADCHGKNQAKDGNFINQVHGFTLHHVDHGLIEVSRDSNSELFDLTCGGFGLTGTIIGVTLRVQPLPSSTMNVSVQTVGDVVALPALLRESFPSANQLVSWHDFNQTGAAFGRGFLHLACFDKIEKTVRDANITTFPIKLSRKQSRLNNLTSENRGVLYPAIYGRVLTGLMNAFYHHSQALKVGASNVLPIQDWYFPNKRSRDFYFHSFGQNGLHEYQINIPIDSFSAFIEKVQWWLSRNDLPVTMASSKLFGGTRKLLRFDGEGICFALDFPRCANAGKFLDFLDQFTIETQSLPNIHKDSRLPLAVVERTYCEYELFRSKLKAFDPKRRYQSELSRRLSL